MSSAICFNLDQSKVLSLANGLNFHKKKVLSPYHTFPTFIDPLNENILGEKEKLW